MGSHTFTGKVISVDPKAQTLVVKASSGEKTFHIRKGTDITISGSEKLLGELQKGEDVTVTYTM